MSDKPLSAEAFERLIKPYRGEGKRLAVAVSGGPDSMALAFLVAQTVGVQKLLALIVEHGLREESAREAAAVAQTLRSMGIETEILPWVHDDVKSRVHVRARDARYGLLIEACKRRGLDTLMIAHHADDQAETVLMRFAKGSGIDGLAGMEAVTVVDGVRLIRPLLGVPKAQLVATCQANDVPYVTDPSNVAEKYARGRLRRVMPLLAQEGFTSERLLDLADRAREAKDALTFYTQAFLQEAAHRMEGGAFRLDLAALRGCPPAVALRALTQLLMVLHRADYPPERKQLLPLYAWLIDQDEGEARTLSGVIIQKGDLCDKAIFLREPEAISDCQPVRAGQTVLWDGRWQVTVCEPVGIKSDEPVQTNTPTPLPNPSREGEGISLVGNGEGRANDQHFNPNVPVWGGVIPSPSREGLGRGESQAVPLLEIRALGTQQHEVLDRLAPRLRTCVPQGRVRAGLPALWCGQDLVAIPSFTKADQGLALAVPCRAPWE